MPLSSCGSGSHQKSIGKASAVPSPWQHRHGVSAGLHHLVESSTIEGHAQGSAPEIPSSVVAG